MFSFQQLDDIFKQNMKQFVSQSQNRGENTTGGNREGITLSPPQLLVMAGFLAGVLLVSSITVDSEQEVQIVLVGSLKKNDTNGMMDQIKSMSFEDLMKMMSGR